MTTALAAAKPHNWLKLTARGRSKATGPKLGEGRSLIHEAQRALVCPQTRVVVSAFLNCPQGRRALSIKATHAVRYRTVFGKVTVDSPQLRVCKCVQDHSAYRSARSHSRSRCALVLSSNTCKSSGQRIFPLRLATRLLKEVLPVDQAISTSGLRIRVWTVGQDFDNHAESSIHGERDYPPADSNVRIAALAVDLCMDAPPAFS